MKINALKNSAPYIIIAAAALLLFRGIFKPGFMSGADNSFHFYQSYYMAKVFLPENHWISGWSMQYLTGAPILVDYCQLGFLLIAFLNKILFLPLNISYKLLVFFSYVILGVGFYKIAASRFGRIPSLLACICLMLQKDIYYDRILSGMWNFYLAVGIFLIFFHVLDKEIEKVDMKKALLLGLLLGLVILAHLFVAFFAFLILGLYGIWYLHNIAKQKRPFLKKSLIYATIPVCGLLISSYYLRNVLLAESRLVNMYPKEILTGLSWGIKALFGPLESGKEVFYALMINFPVLARIIFCLLGLTLFVKKRHILSERRFLTSAIALTLMALVLFSEILPNIFGFWHSIPLIRNLEASRFLVFIHIGMYLLAAFGISEFLRTFRRKRLFINTFVILIALSSFTNYTHWARNGSRVLEESKEMHNVLGLWDWVNANVSPRRTRIVYQNTLGSIDDAVLKRSDVFSLSGIFTKTAQIGTSPFLENVSMRCDKNRIFGKDISLASASFISDNMNRFNSSYIVSVEPGLEKKLAQSSLFAKEKEFGPLSVFKMNSPTGKWIKYQKSATYKTKVFKNQRLLFDIQNKSPDNIAAINISYHPLWKAWLNGNPVKLKGNKYGLIEISLPDIGRHELKLSFSSFSRFWFFISLCSLIMALAFGLRFNLK